MQLPTKAQTMSVISATFAGRYLARCLHPHIGPWRLPGSTEMFSLCLSTLFASWDLEEYVLRKDVTQWIPRYINKQAHGKARAATRRPTLDT
jgi:hypothetical protein